VAPTTSSLMNDVLGFLLDVQGVHGALGMQQAVGTIGAGASVAEVNRYLAANTDRAVAIAFPYALPRGFGLRGTKIWFGADNPNRGYLETTLVVEPGAKLDELMTALKQSAVFAGDEQLQRLVGQLQQACAGQRFELTVRLQLDKGPASSARMGQYFVLPAVLESHVVVGNLATRTEGLTGDHVIEISEPFLQAGTKAALQLAGVLGGTYDVHYGPSWARRKGSVTVDDLYPDCTTGGLQATAKAHGFFPLVVSDRGVNVSTGGTSGTLSLSRVWGRQNVFRASASFSGVVRIDTSLGWLVDMGVAELLGMVGEAIFDLFPSGIESFVTGQLGNWVSLCPGSRVKFKDVSLGASGVSFDLEPVDLDLGATVRRFVGDVLPVEVTDVRGKDDRLVLVLSNRR